LNVEPHHGRGAVRKEQLCRGRECREALLVRGCLLGEGLIDLETASGEQNRRLQHVFERLGAETVERRLPGGESARHPDRQADETAAANG
jgi:hypothetical protein